MAIWLASCRYAGAATKGSSVHSQKTVSSRRQRICASRCRLALSKQARRAPHLDAERAAQPRQPAAEGEGDGERAVDVDAQAARHALVVDRSPHLRAEARVFQRIDEQGGDGEGGDDEKQAIRRKAHSHELY